MSEEILSLKHKKLLFDRLKEINLRLSEFSFANLYLFRKLHNYTITLENNCLCITGLTTDQKKFVLPVCETCKFDIKHLDFLLEKYGMLFPIAEKWLPNFNDSKYIINHCDNDSDYIFTTEKMATYSGRKLHKKRNLLKQFHENHNFTSFKLTTNHIPDAISVLDLWQENSNKLKENTDYESCLEALHNITALELKGIIFYVENSAAGFLLGEALTSDTFVLHFAKAHTKYKGIYQLMYNELAKNLLNKFKYINFEQDLGIQSLRQAKSSYVPDYMENKYRISLK